MTALLRAKREARARLRAMRDACPLAQRVDADRRIADHVTSLCAFEHADVVLTYLNAGSEVDTRAIVTRAWERQKTVAVPRCVAGKRLMTWHRISSFDGLVRGSFGIEEPKDDPGTLVDLGAGGRLVALVPGIAFDMQGMRLGYGGGYYDVFLSDFEGDTIGLCREGQLVSDLRELGVMEPHDMSVGFVVSERGVRKKG